MSAKDFDYTCKKCNAVYPYSQLKNRLTCPKCSELNNGKMIEGLVTFAVLLLIFVWWFYPNSDDKANSITPHKQQIEQHFSAWDGSHRGVVQFIKAQMKDPSSFEHVSTTYKDLGSYLNVFMTYRGVNSFGAVVTQETMVKTDLNGTVLQQIY